MASIPKGETAQTKVKEKMGEIKNKTKNYLYDELIKHEIIYYNIDFRTFYKFPCKFYCSFVHFIHFCF